MPDWGFLTNHAHVLLCVARDPDTRLRHIGDCVGITERATHRIVCEFVEAGYLEKHRLGRRGFYEVNLDLPLRHTLESDHQLGELLAPFLRGKTTELRMAADGDADSNDSLSASAKVASATG